MRIPTFPGSDAVSRWSNDLSRVLTSAFSALESTKQTRGEIVYLKPYLVSELPNPVPDWQYVMVIDDGGGAIPAFSEDGQWRRVSDRTVVS